MPRRKLLLRQRLRQTDMSLQTGSKGDRVQRLQADLKALGFYPHRVDGDFGRLTRKAVLAFQERFFVDGIVDTSTERAVEAAVAAVANRKREILVTVPEGLVGIEKQFGVIEYVEAGGGYIEITNDFHKRIARVDFPVVGLKYFHHKLVDVLERVLVEIRARGLDGEIKQFATWCPRHKMHDPKRSLSTHSWGIAVDINYATNPIGTRGDLDVGIVESFEKYGFTWGGRWSFKDPMHFNYCTHY